MLASQRSRVRTHTRMHNSLYWEPLRLPTDFHITSLSIPPATFSVGVKGPPVHPRSSVRVVRTSLSHLLEHHAELLQGLLCHSCGVSVEEEYEDQDPSGSELPSLQ